MSTYKDLPQLHEMLLQHLLDYRSQKRPGLTFALRKINNRGRLDKGYWFHGNDTYILVCFTMSGVANNRTNEFGFGFEPGKKGSHISLVTGEETPPLLKSFYDSIVKTIPGFEPDLPNKPHRFFKYYTPKNRDPISCLNEFLENDFRKIYDLSVEKGLANDLWVPEERFQEDLLRLKRFRKE